jgi:hypothetical protein
MGLPTTTTGPTNVYYLIDDYGTSAGPAGGQSGGTSGNPVSPDFTAATIGGAMQVAFLWASTFQRPCRLVVKYGGIGQVPTLIQGQAANTALTNAPSGIGY